MGWSESRAGDGGCSTNLSEALRSKCTRGPTWSSKNGREKEGREG